MEKFLAEGNKLPGNFGENAKTIYYTMQRNKYDGWWAKEYRIPGFRSKACCGGAQPEITVFGGNHLGEDIFHEMGHNMAYQLWGSSSPPSRSVWGKMWRQFKNGTAKEFPVSKYGKASIAEDFAEAVQMYITDPRTLRNYHPKRFAYIKKFIEGGGE